MKTQVPINNTLMKFLSSNASVKLFPLYKWAVLEIAQIFLTWFWIEVDRYTLWKGREKRAQGWWCNSGLLNCHVPPRCYTLCGFLLSFNFLLLNTDSSTVLSPHRETGGCYCKGNISEKTDHHFCTTRWFWSILLTSCFEHQNALWWGWRKSRFFFLLFASLENKQVSAVTLRNGVTNCCCADVQKRSQSTKNGDIIIIRRTWLRFIFFLISVTKILCIPISWQRAMAKNACLLSVRCTEKEGKGAWCIWKVNYWIRLLR